MVTAARSITNSRARPELDRGPELTVDALMARMRSAAERAGSPAMATRAAGNGHGIEQPDPAEFMQLQVEFNQALVAAVNSIAQYLKQSRGVAKPTQENQPAADVITRVDLLTAQISDLAQRLDQAIAASNAADQNHRALIDAGSARLETICQSLAAAQQQAAVQLNDAQQRLTAQQVAVEQVQHDVAAAGRRGQSHLAESELRLLRLERDLRKYAGSSPRPAIPQPDSTPPQQSTGAPDLPFDYFLFEHRFRGSIEEIKHRQEAYLEYFAHAESVIDLGCGRGEFVELMVERDIPVIGVDLNEDMIDFCKARGLPVLKRDLFEFLTAQSDGSLGSIFVSQVVEHLPAERVWALIQLAAQKLKIGGVLLLETINPQCFAAMSCFYLDPSHARPYHAALLAFMCEQAGFRLECMQFSAPLTIATTGAVLKCFEHIPPAEAVHYQDYAVLARRMSLPR